MQFVKDMELIYDNCCFYNGDGSEYYRLAEEMKKMFQSLVKVYLKDKILERDNKGNAEESYSEGTGHSSSESSHRNHDMEVAQKIHFPIIT